MKEFVEGNVVDVRNRTVFPARVWHENGVITDLEHVSTVTSGLLIPGLIDSHIHIESSLLCPSRFAEAVVPHGTTAVITDPHEIANVLGLPGIDYMTKDSKTVPLRVYFTAPSCVPATQFETAGASIGVAEIEQLLSRDDFVALGEMMNYPGAIKGDEEVLAKIAAAKKHGKPVDGHCPMLTGAKLKKYVERGISTDHECTSSKEAGEKARLGMKIMVRQGSASKDLPSLVEFAKKNDFLLVSDDKSAGDLLHGHVDRMLAEAVALGVEPMHALRAVTINPALHYNLPLGVIEPGRMADMVRVSDLRSFQVDEVYIGGQLVGAKHAAKFAVKPKEMVNQFVLQRRIPSDFDAICEKPVVKARVIGLVKDEIVTESLATELRTENGRVLPDVEKDVLRIAVVNRYRDAPVSNGFVKGFGLKSGALASSVAHDSHNIIVVGASTEDMAMAVNALVSEGGGFCVCAGGKTSVLGLHIAGLMCTKPAFDVSHRLSQLRTKARALGCELEQPFMAMSFLSLLVIPKLKIGDKGLFDVGKFKFVEVISK